MATAYDVACVGTGSHAQRSRVPPVASGVGRLLIFAAMVVMLSLETWRFILSQIWKVKTYPRSSV